MVKKLLFGALTAAAVRFVMAKMQSGQAEQSLWAEATDPVKPNQ